MMLMWEEDKQLCDKMGEGWMGRMKMSILGHQKVREFVTK